MLICQFYSPVSDGEDDVVDPGLLEDVVDALLGVAGHVLAVDLEDLVAEAEPAHRGRAGLGHEAHEHALVDRLDLQADLAVGVLAQNDLGEIQM